jgi:hypothetical protein
VLAAPAVVLYAISVRALYAGQVWVMRVAAISAQLLTGLALLAKSE